NYFYGDPINSRTSGGSFTTNLINGFIYRVTFSFFYSSYSLTNIFDTNAVGTVNASAPQYQFSTNSIVGALSAYTRSASDARYSPLLEHGTNVVLYTEPTNGKIVVNATGAGGSGGSATNAIGNVAGVGSVVSTLSTNAGVITVTLSFTGVTNSVF